MIKDAVCSSTKPSERGPEREKTMRQAYVVQACSDTLPGPVAKWLDLAVFIGDRALDRARAYVITKQAASVEKRRYCVTAACELNPDLEAQCNATTDQDRMET